MNAKRTLCPFSCVFAMAFQSGLATEGPPPVLNPKTHVSPSGAYSLAVDPTDLYGRGPADYRFTREGKTVWARRMPYSLWQAVVTDSGHVAGYGYTHGWRGFSEKGYDDGPGEFIVSLLSPDGKALNEEQHKREQSRFLHAPPNPLVHGILLDASNRRFVLRVADPDVNRRIEQWWVYDMEMGKRIGTLEPGRATQNQEGKETRVILGAAAVSGTPLVLTSWLKYAWRNSGGVFTLVDLNDSKAKPVWSLTLDGDYSMPQDEKAEDALRGRIRKKGVILSSDKPAGFAIHAVKQRQRIDFSVRKTSNGTWQVRETSRTPYEFPSESAPEARTFPPIKLEELAVVRLRGSEARKESPIRDVRGFGFGADGKMCLLSVPRRADPHLLQITQQGKILNDLRLPVRELPKVVDWSNPVSVGAGRFVVTVSDGEEEGKARCFIAEIGRAHV